MYDFIPFVGDPLKQKEKWSAVSVSSLKSLTIIVNTVILISFLRYFLDYLFLETNPTFFSNKQNMFYLLDL